LANVTTSAGTTAKGRALIKVLQTKIKCILTPPASTATLQKEQRLREEEQRGREEEQRVVDDTPIITIPCITNAPPIMQARNPTSKCALKLKPRIHKRVTRNNTPGGLPPINRVHPIPNKDTPRELPTRRISTRKDTGNMTPPTTAQSLPTRARHRIVSRQAINALTIQEQVSMDTAFIPNALRKHHVQQVAPNLEHYAYPMVHPITGKTISSYKKLMKDPATAEVWQTTFRKEFEGMAQGENKTGQKGTNAMFVMNHKNIKKILKAGKKITYANPVVDLRP
jgi:hypothetical protein